MTHCYNCGHAGTFVLLAQFALAVSGPAADPPARTDHPVGSDRRRRTKSDDAHRGSSSTEDHRHSNSCDPRRSPDWPRSCDPNRSRRGRGGPTEETPETSHSRDAGRNRSSREDSPLGNAPSAGDGLPTNGGLSLAVQCPVCDSTDVGVAAADLLARYGSSTTS